MWRQPVGVTRASVPVSHPSKRSQTRPEAISERRFWCSRSFNKVAAANDVTDTSIASAGRLCPPDSGVASEHTSRQLTHQVSGRSQLFLFIGRGHFYLSSIPSPVVICKLDVKSRTVADGLPAGPQMVIHGCAVSSEILPLSHGCGVMYTAVTRTVVGQYSGLVYVPILSRQATILCQIWKSKWRITKTQSKVQLSNCAKASLFYSDKTAVMEPDHISDHKKCSIHISLSLFYSKRYTHTKNLTVRLENCLVLQARD